MADIEKSVKKQVQIVNRPEVVDRLVNAQEGEIFDLPGELDEDILKQLADTLQREVHMFQSHGDLKTRIVVGAVSSALNENERKQLIEGYTEDIHNHPKGLALPALGDLIYATPGDGKTYIVIGKSGVTEYTAFVGDSEVGDELRPAIVKYLIKNNKAGWPVVTAEEAMTKLENHPDSSWREGLEKMTPVQRTKEATLQAGAENLEEFEKWLRSLSNEKQLRLIEGFSNSLSKPLHKTFSWEDKKEIEMLLQGGSYFNS